jgi:glycerol kinase
VRIIAIDQGTTSTRAVTFESGAPPQVVALIRHRQLYPQSGWVEHDPAELLANVKECLQAGGRADAIGLANQGESCLAWDSATHEPLSPVIVWQDQRTAGQIERLKADGLTAEVAIRAGLPLDSYFSAAKLAWILQHTPAARAALRAGTLRLGTTDSFFLECLTGVYVTDASTASRTSLMNLRTVQWDPTLCQAFGVPMHLLAPIRPTTGNFGHYQGIPITASIVDQQAALFGHGCTRRGDAKVTFGTGAFAQVMTGDAPLAIEGTGLIATVASQTLMGTKYALEGGTYDAGAAVEWAMRVGLLGDLSELQSLSPPSAMEQGLIYIPALSGLACPQWNRGVRGLWSGLNTATTRRALHQSVLEGVALQTNEVLTAMDTAILISGSLSVDGGLTESPYFLQFLADVTDKRIIRTASTEITAYGCALLAGLDADALTLDASDSTRCYEPTLSTAQRLTMLERYRAATNAAVSLSTGAALS